MTKTTYCPECSGRGYIQRSEVIDNGDGTGSGRVWAENCGECNGTGFKTVPIINADRIRAMSDEELADVFGNPLCILLQQAFRERCVKRAVCDGCVLEWLKEPAKEDE